MHQPLFGGWIEVVCGPMFAGKTEEIIRRIRRLEYAKKNVLVFKPTIDDRYSSSEIVSHNKTKAKSININKAIEILDYIKEGVDAVVIDEAQFLDNDVIWVSETLADRGIRVIIGGLDRDFRGEPFGPMPQLLAIAEFVQKLTAVCVVTGQPATRTQRLINGKPASYNDPIVLVGASEAYEPRSRDSHEVRNKPKHDE
ncbi:thymidine kinase [Acholeplasma vituli]|uniref:Thymidine kinase n=1 Tax=Paracholeplasma vituli TaxID=69473 RepID=A0ABT2PSW3_9MOLU|nr:thymidine kinase [Paracholeplasma vituli]MCU0104053.1 thymidine kinase [Paracholeplasma vituli]